ncbi:hypothetical protein QQY66_49065 [Streptomyces sp. DG2A-72]|uniref:hypothetical protein n=1 Tax=Streptomyces sp. DG2A-72 TaxID=3051386 RepID=UPI00265C62D3|nr:hypothetical protein [Streptomyces sp. DG2A-72]MDO0939265.1 hypothetical protein [Streptomyces sp. DG2A-72]
MESTTHSYAEAALVHHPEPMSGHPAAYRPIVIKTTAEAVSAPIADVVEVRTLDGRTIYQYAAVPAAEPANPAPASNAVPAWAKTTALLLVSASASLVMAAYAAKVFAEAATALVAALLLLAKVAVVLAFVFALAVAVVAKRRRGGGQTATATATATAGLFGRAKAVATATINNG